MVKTFLPLVFVRYYKGQEAYRNMYWYLTQEASSADLEEVFEQLTHIPVCLTLSGYYKGYEIIQEPFWIWRKGIPRIHIEEFLLRHLKR